MKLLGGEPVLLDGESRDAGDELASLRIRNQQLLILCSDLKRELSASKSESIHVTGVQSGLQTRLNEQDVSVLQLKSELLAVSMAKEQETKEKADLLTKLDESTRLVSELKVRLLTFSRLLVYVKCSPFFSSSS